MKKNNNKISKTLIVVTFLIAVFFFVRWVNDVVPRYEIVERIEIGEVRCHENRSDKWCYIDEELFDDVKSFYCEKNVPLLKTEDEKQKDWWTDSEECLGEYIDKDGDREYEWILCEEDIYKYVRICYFKYKVRVK